jgi:transcriptional regulator with XRE-family HTH domain
MIDFADNIYLWRIFRGLSQEELAVKTGIPRPNISVIERGSREVTLATVRRLAAALKVKPGMLVNGVAPPYFKGKKKLSRKSLELIIEAILNKAKRRRTSLNNKHLQRFTSFQKAVGVMFSNIIKNKLNADDRVYRNTIKRSRRDYINHWLILKITLGAEVCNNLLSRLNKHIMIREKTYE